MAVNEVFVRAAPEEVFAVLRDPTRYGDWVVGTEKTVPGDGRWPEPGSDLRYSTAGPIRLRDRTIVVHADEPRRLVLRSKASPLPDADIVIDVAAEGDGTRVRMEERPAHPVVNLLLGPLGHFLLARRNHVALARLQRLAEGRA